MNPSKNRMPVSRIIERLFAFVLAGLLLVSAANHAGNGFLFLSTVYSYQIVSRDVGIAAASLIPAIQVTVAIGLISRWWIRPNYFLAASLFAGFFLVQYSAWQRSLEISCGCFGTGDRLPIGLASMSLAGGCMAASVVGFILARSSCNPGVPCEQLPDLA